MSFRRKSISPESRRLPALLIVCTLSAILSPAAENWKRKPADNFPLSYFPMFSAKRGATYTAQTIYGVDPGGERVVLPYGFAGAGGFNSVRRQLRVRVREQRADSLCTKVADRVSRSQRSEHGDLREVRIASETHDVDAFFAGVRRPLSEELHASCPIPSSGDRAEAQKLTGDAR